MGLEDNNCSDWNFRNVQICDRFDVLHVLLWLPHIPHPIQPRRTSVWPIYHHQIDKRVSKGRRSFICTGLPKCSPTYVQGKCGKWKFTRELMLRVQRLNCAVVSGKAGNTIHQQRWTEFVDLFRDQFKGETVWTLKQRVISQVNN